MEFAKTLFEHGHISAEQFIEVRNYSIQNFSTDVEALRALEIVSTQTIPQFFRQYFKFQMLDESTLANLDPRLAEILPEDLAIHLRVFCLGGHKNRLLIATEDPGDRAKKRQIEFFLAKKIIFVAASQQQMDAILNKFYKNEHMLVEVESKAEPVMTSKKQVNSLHQQENKKPPQKKIDNTIEEIAAKVDVSNQNSEAANTDLDRVSTVLDFNQDEPASVNITELEDVVVPPSNIDPAELTPFVSAALVKIGFCKTKDSAMEALNAKIAVLGIVVSWRDNAFLIQSSQYSISVEPQNLEPEKLPSPFPLLIPALKRISKLA